MINKKIRKLARAMVDGELSFEQFWRQTSADWDRIAAYVMRRWSDLPTAVGREDVVQEMAVAVHRYLKKFDPTKGTEPGDYYMFTAITAAKRWLHDQRGKVRSDKNQSRHPIAFACLGKDERASALKTERPENPGQEVAFEAEAEFGALIGDLVRSGGDVGAAAEVVAVRFHIGPERARIAIEQAVERAAEKADRQLEAQGD
jgi:hypothetical protein